MTDTICDRLEARLAKQQEFATHPDTIPVTLDEWVQIAEYLFGDKTNQMIRGRGFVPLDFLGCKILLVSTVVDGDGRVVYCP